MPHLRPLCNDAVPEKAPPLLGTWKVTMIMADGKEEKAPDGKSMTLEFTADKLIIHSDGTDKKEATWSVDPSPKPKALDLVPHDFGEKGKTVKGIYEFDGDTLKICACDKSQQD